ncbi:MAG: hypothetical protein ACK5LK_04440 [Chthoniobacterales bacterium]
MKPSLRNLTNPAKIREQLGKRKLLWSVIIGVVALHVLIITVFGSLVIFRHLFKNEVTFEAAPEFQKRIDPQKLQHKVKVQKQQQKSGRPRVQPRLQANRISEYSLPKIDIDPEKIKNPVKSNLPSIGASGLGSGTMGGRGSGGLGIGMSQVSFFGIKARVEKVAIIFDLSSSMIADERGGAAGFDALKSEIKDVIRALNASSFFLLIGFDSDVYQLAHEAILATKENIKEAESWIDPFEIGDPYLKEIGSSASDNQTQRPDNIAVVGLDTDEDRDETVNKNMPTIENGGGRSRHDMALKAAMQAGVDTIFLISDGAPALIRPFTEKEQKLFETQMKNENLVKLREKNLQRHLENRRKENERRAKRGLPPKVIENDSFDSPIISRGLQPNDLVLDYIEELVDYFYVSKGKEKPRIYTIGYVTDAKSESFMRQLSRQNRGRFRRVPTLVKPIRDF